MTPCPSCGEPMPDARLTIPVANGVCAACNAVRPRREFAQACYGFKNNGSTLVPVSEVAAHAENVKVVG